jgi:hypothetical protein
MRTGRMLATAAVTVSAAWSATPAAADPSTDEYTLRLPDAGGRQLGPEAPNPRVSDLPASTQQQLEDNPDGDTLAQIATAPELGAPAVLPAQIPAGAIGAGTGTGTGTGDDESSGGGAAGAAVSALGEPAALGVLGTLAAMIAFGIGWTMRSRRDG